MSEGPGATPSLLQFALILFSRIISPHFLASDCMHEEMEVDIFQLSQHALNDNAGMDLGPPSMRPVDHRVRKAVNLMRSDPTRPHRIDEVAHLVGLSRSRFFQQFRDGMGMSPGVYSDTLRVEYAIDALISTDRPAGDIALDLGFSAPGHFSRFFKDKIGFAPQDYRRVAHQLSRRSAGAMIAPAAAPG